MNLHLESVWLIGALTAFMYGFLLLAVRPAGSGYLSRTMFGTAICGFSLGLAFLLRSGMLPIPEGLRLLAPNALVPLSLGFGYRVMAEMQQRQSSRLWIYLPPLVVAGSTLWFSYVQRNITICQIMYNTENAGLLLAIAVLLGRGGAREQPKTDRMAQAAFVLLALSTLGVVAAFLAEGKFPVEYDFSQPRAVYNVTATVTFASLIYFIILLMIFERLNAELKEQALCDPLTGVYNRRAFEGIAFREISGARRSGVPLALIVCDIDLFKVVNDTYGHVAGDEVLREVAQQLRANLRDEDTLCRWGGDEFVALLPRASAQDARQVAERIAAAFRNCSFTASGVQIQASVSLGVAAGERVDLDLSTLLHEADQAMYRAKQKFRQSQAKGEARVTLSGE